MSDTTPAAIEALLKDVTPGPWVVYGEPEVGLPPGLFSGTVGQTGFGPLEPLSSYDLVFIAAARDLVPALAAERDAALTEAAALRKEVERLREALSDPIAVHANMLRGAIAMPSVENIIHAYGAEALRATLAALKGATE